MSSYRSMQRKAHKKAQSVSSHKIPGVFAVFIRMLFLAAASAALSGGALFALQSYYQITGRIVPGIWTSENYLSGLTHQEAAELIAQEWDGSELTLIDSEDMSRTWTIPSSEIGVNVSSIATADTAYEIGHTPDVLQNLLDIILSYRNGVLVQPTAELDVEAARMFLEAFSEQVNTPPIDGTLLVENGVISARNGVPGRQIDIDSTIALIAEDPLSILKYGFLPMPMVPWEPQIVDVTKAAERAAGFLESGWKVQAYDPVSGEYLIWQPSAAQIGTWIRITSQETDYLINLDETAYGENLRVWVDSLGENRRLDYEKTLTVARNYLEAGVAETLIISYTPTTWQVSAGETLSSIAARIGIPAWKILEYNPEISSTGLVQASTITIPPADANLEHPVIPHKRIIISISDQEMWVYENQEQIREFIISTGIEESPTMPGVFQVLMHEINAYGSRWDLYMPHFLGIYEALPGFTNGIHGLPMLSNGQRLWANVLGQPASYGCIILNLDAAEWLYDWAEDGVVVEIIR